MSDGKIWHVCTVKVPFGDSFFKTKCAISFFVEIVYRIPVLIFLYTVYGANSLIYLFYILICTFKS